MPDMKLSTDNETHNLNNNLLCLTLDFFLVMFDVRLMHAWEQFIGVCC